MVLAQYPLLIPGCHRLSFLDGAATLDLWFGDVQQVLPKIDIQQIGLIDAWYLDGFTPSKNPDMWSQSLFEYMALLAKDQCSFATFTAASFVKRGLKIAAAQTLPPAQPDSVINKLAPAISFINFK